MTLTLGDCLQAEAALVRLGSQPWSLKTAYHLAKLLRLVRTCTKAFEDERVATIKEIGSGRAATDVERARGSDAEVFEVPPEKMGDYLRRHRELRERPVAIAWSPLTLEEFGDEARLMGVDLADLGPLLADPLEETTVEERRAGG